ncbi:MAG: prepilin peptidase [Parvularculaceae bacterium]
MHWGIYVTAAAIGLIAGSFLNVVAFRGPARWGLVTDERPRGDLARPRSYCPYCRKPIAARWLAPVVGYLALRGRCAECGAAIPARYPIVEVAGALVAALAVWRFGASAEAMMAALFGWTLVALAAIDWETHYLPDALTLPLLAGGIAFNTVDLFAPLPGAVFGAAVGYGAFWLVARVYKSVRGREGLGLGDAKLLAAIGAWVGWTALPVVVFAAAALSLAALALAAVIGKRVDAAAPAPFGPGLALAGFGALLI